MQTDRINKFLTQIKDLTGTDLVLPPLDTSSAALDPATNKALIGATTSNQYNSMPSLQMQANSRSVVQPGTKPIQAKPSINNSLLARGTKGIL